MGSHPLAEAAYLQRVSNFDLFYENYSGRINSNFYSIKLEQTGYGALFNYASNHHPFTGSAGYESLHLSVDGDEVDSAKNWQVTAGSYIGQTGRILARYAQLYSEGTRGTSFGVEAKYVAELSNNSAVSFVLNVLQARTESDDDPTIDSTGYDITADYYITAATSLGFNRIWQSDKDDFESSDSWEHRFRIRHFLSPKASVALVYMNSDYAYDNHGFTVEAAFRI